MSASNAILSFTLFAGLVLAGDYVIFAQHNKALAISGQTPGSYWDNLSARLSATRAPDTKTALPGFLPPAPAGWTRAPYVRADGESVTARRYIPTSLAVDTTNDLLGDLESEMANEVHIAETYAMGDRRVIIAITHRPAQKGLDFTSRMVAEVTLAIGNSAGSGPAYGVVKGAVFHQKPQLNHDGQSNTDTPVDYRRFTAGLGSAMDVMVVTNAPDADVQAILGDIDMVGLAAVAAVPEAIVNDYRPTVWGAEKAAKALSEKEFTAEAVPDDRAVLRQSVEGQSVEGQPVEGQSIWGLFASLGKTGPEQTGPNQTDPEQTASTEADSGRRLDLAKPAQGTCVRRAGALICP